ncbi:MAG: Gfo/Idh/MocA family oxidoreductase [Planctomycetes bacterium]|nr:Gfo/Idh/MocA family oxidoreductase [Planctomycetota bacterium]
MKLAIVGLDSPYWPMAFADSIGRIGGHPLAAACDLWCRDREVRSQIGAGPWEFAEKRELRLVHSIDAVAAEADACLVCTRNTRMADVVEQLLDAKKPVYVAKPVAITIDDMRRILAARERSRLICAAGQTARSSFALRTVRRLIAEGRIGDILSMRIAHQHGRFADWNKDWWYTDPAEGDAFDWLGWYVLDGALAIAGRRVARIAGAARRHLAPFGDMPDLIRGMAELDDGRIATLEVHFTVGGWGISFVEVEVVGTRGVLRAIGPAEEVAILSDKGTEKIPWDRGKDPLDLEIDAWLRAIGGDGAPLLTLEESSRIVAAAIAWKRAAGEGRWVEVPALA